MKAVQKDRLHTINRYKHLRETDPAEAEQLRQRMAEHLRKVDGQLTVALGMLDRVPTYKKKVEMQISTSDSRYCCSKSLRYIYYEIVQMKHRNRM